MYFPLAWYAGYCATCDTEQPLVLVEHGPRGLRAWLSGTGPEDRDLSYTCRVCGRVEHVPLTEAEDDEYAATLLTWPDTFLEAAAAVPTVVQPAAVVEDDVYAVAARTLLAAPPVPPRRPTLRVITLPEQRVHATDLLLAAV